MTTYAITDIDARRILTATQYTALLDGGEHGLTRDDVERTWTGYKDTDTLVSALEQAGGGWTIDDDGETAWVPAAQADLDEGERLARQILDGRGASETWKDAGYRSAWDAAVALVGGTHTAAHVVAAGIVAERLEAEGPQALTADTITDEQIEALRREAAEAGDLLQVAICDVALVDGLSDIAEVDDEHRAALEAMGIIPEHIDADVRARAVLAQETRPNDRRTQAEPGRVSHVPLEDHAVRDIARGYYHYRPDYPNRIAMGGTLRTPTVDQVMQTLAARLCEYLPAPPDQPREEEA